MEVRIIKFLSQYRPLITLLVWIFLQLAHRQDSFLGWGLIHVLVTFLWFLVGY
jgi:hypothetical protein